VRSPRPVLLLVLCAILASTALAACGKRSEGASADKPNGAESVSLLLDYLPNADHAGIYAAQSTGEFAKAGLNVKISTPTDAATPLKLLLAGKTDLAISYEPELLLARDKGAKLVGVGALIQEPLTSVMSTKKGFTGVGDLKGATVGTAGIPYQSAYLKTILKTANVPAAGVSEVNVGFNLVKAMTTGKVDATLGAFWNVEGVQLQQAKKHPTIIPVNKAGVPTYDELVIVSTPAYIRDHGPLIRRLIQALKRGTDAVRANPQVGVAALQKADPTLTDTKFLTASVEATIPAFYPTDKTRPFGWQDPSQWEAFAAWMTANGLLTQPARETSLTNEFLPGQGI
jgi:putative hydroxymethylpyrimidine transport system substrate-binding protein